MRLPIVDENDNIIGFKDKKERKPSEICRISGLWVIAPNMDILLAQRGFNKKNHPGLWGPAVAGTVEEGETYESNIIKEAEEEIGLTGMQLSLGPKIRKSSSHEYFVQWFTTTVGQDFTFRKEDKEVESIKWFSREELNKLLKEKPEMFLPDFYKYFKFFSNETQS
ncbi:MAG: NUDIX domain-containing protein [bacterium]|nr:NUDIX domain-containing protein [bacterium]